MAATKKPTGLAIARNGLKFTLTWKKGDTDYNAGQQVEYKTNLNTTWTALSVNASATSKAVSLTASSYFPTTAKKLTTVYFRVRGKRAATTKKDVTTTYSWSSWASKDFTVKIPNKPSMATSTSSNSSTFTWETDASTTDNRPYVNVLYQTMLIHNCNETNGDKLRWASTQSGWQESTGSMNGSITKTEDSTALAAGSYTRWIRVKSRGAAGESEWRYGKHVYARPYKATITDTGSTQSDANTTVRVEWTATTDAAHPIDQTNVQYVIATPASGLACPAGASWEDAGHVYDTKGTDSLRFTISNQVQNDECLWARVVNVHDENSISSNSTLVRTGSLSAPSGLTVSNINSTTYTATITATNNSNVPDSKLAIIYRKSGQEFTVGVINVNSGNSGSATVKCPSWGDASKIGFKVYAFQGTYTTEEKNGVTYYTINSNMESAKLYDNSSIPKAPATVTLNPLSNLTEVVVHWLWTWHDADQAEISWSDRSSAWESTAQPSTYVVNNYETTNKWRVCDLEPGKTYYFRVRLGQNTEDGVVWGPYSDTCSAGLYAEPDKPALQLSAATVVAGKAFTASWEYSSRDGIEQGGAQVCAFPVGTNLSDWNKAVVATTKSAHAVNITATNWTPGTTYELHVRVTSKKDKASEWSDAVVIHVPEVLACAISSTSLSAMTVTDSDGGTRSVTALRTLPLTLTVTGAPAGGSTTVIVEREDEYHMLRPDETMFDGFAGETIVLYKQTGSATISIDKSDLLGRFDDGAPYLLTAIVSADNAISAQAQISFEVHWSTQAKVPNAATIEYLANAVKITPSATSPATGTTCDIYRLSADRPELIIQDGSFGTAYVDPYPTIGEKGGYRVVYKTAYGDYITSNNLPAWTDTEAGLDEYSIIIDFNGRQAVLPYDLSLASRWTKDFKLTNYLGGAQQGDWNPAINRTASYTVDLYADDDEVVVMRELSAWDGICHIRTPEGSSYSCNIDVSESKMHSNWDIISYTLAVTRVDPETLDGVPYSLWSA